MRIRSLCKQHAWVRKSFLARQPFIKYLRLCEIHYTVFGDGQINNCILSQKTFLEHTSLRMIQETEVAWEASAGISPAKASWVAVMWWNFDERTPKCDVRTGRYEIDDLKSMGRNTPHEFVLEVMCAARRAKSESNFITHELWKRTVGGHFGKGVIGGDNVMEFRPANSKMRSKNWPTRT